MMVRGIKQGMKTRKPATNYAKSMGESIRDVLYEPFDDSDPRACSRIRTWFARQAKKGRRVSVWRTPSNGTLSDVAIVGDLSAS